MISILLALFAYTLAAHITTETWCTSNGVCNGDAPYVAHHVELGDCYIDCNLCASGATCTNVMFSNDQGSNLIFQYIFQPTTAGSEPNCDNEPVAEANFTCKTCYDPLARGVPSSTGGAGTSVRFSCRTASAEDALEAIASEQMRVAISAGFTSFLPVVSGEIIYGDPSQSGNTVVWIIRINFATTLPAGKITDAQDIFRTVIADQIGTPEENVNVVLVVASSKRAAQIDTTYDAIVTISGVAKMAASALLSLVFLALFI